MQSYHFILPAHILYRGQLNESWLSELHFILPQERQENHEDKELLIVKENEKEQ